jgi:hypothetical protein
VEYALRLDDPVSDELDRIVDSSDRPRDRPRRRFPRIPDRAADL